MKPENEILIKLYTAIFDLNAIVKEHLTDASGRTTANFTSIDKALKEAISVIGKEQKREDKRQEDFERKVMGDQF